MFIEGSGTGSEHKCSVQPSNVLKLKAVQACVPSHSILHLSTLSIGSPGGVTDGHWLDCQTLQVGPIQFVCPKIKIFYS